MSKKRKGGIVDAGQGTKRAKVQRHANDATNRPQDVKKQPTAMNASSAVCTTEKPPAEEDMSIELSSSSMQAGPSKIASTILGHADSKPASSKRKTKDDYVKKLNTLPSGYTMRKLAPQRPFPVVPTSVSATGPRSAHRGGKNLICITRKTPLGSYLRRCKEVIMKDGYKTLHLHAMGPAISHLLTLTVSLPAILPYPAEDIHTEVRTGTVDLRDEILPDDEDEDISCRTRSKSSLSVIIKIGGGDLQDRNVMGMRIEKAAMKEKTKTRRKRGKGQQGDKDMEATGAAGAEKGKSKAREDDDEGPEEMVVYKEVDMDEDEDEMESD